MILATGQQLAARLETYRCRLHGDEIPRCIGQKISAALDAADHQLRRKAVILAILGMIDPDDSLSVNQAAVRIAAALRKINGKPLERIQNGSREATPSEELLVAWLDCKGQQSSRRIGDEIVKGLTPD